MSHGDGTNAEPDWTPMLDMVFQLVTFFMLVINFKAANMDLSLKLPVIGSARPLETEGGEDFLVLNINKKGEVLVYGAPVKLDQYIANEAAASRRKLSPEAAKDPAAELPSTVVIRADKGVPFKDLNRVFTECQKRGFRKFALKAFNMEDPSA